MNNKKLINRIILVVLLYNHIMICMCKAKKHKQNNKKIKECVIKISDKKKILGLSDKDLLAIFSHLSDGQKMRLRSVSKKFLSLLDQYIKESSKFEIRVKSGVIGAGFSCCRNNTFKSFIEFIEKIRITWLKEAKSSSHKNYNKALIIHAEGKCLMGEIIKNRNESLESINELMHNLKKMNQEKKEEKESKALLNIGVFLFFTFTILAIGLMQIKI